jgi:hypothetical protein
MKRFIHVSTLLMLFCALTARAAEYEISRNPDGPFSFSISGVALNEGSSLVRESILFNEPSSPVKISSHSTKIIYTDRTFRFAGNTVIQVSAPIVAIEVRSSLYDAFGQHMKNLSNVEVRDFGAGNAVLDGEWRAFDNEVSEMLTAVTYVARARFADGTQWIFDIDNLQLALSTLDLEQEIGSDEEDGDE